MADPLNAKVLVAALKDEGVHVVERPGWTTHNRAGHGAWGPVNGVMMHHTGAYQTESAMVELCWTGYRQLPGPLCHGVIKKDGTVVMVGHGRANHAGLGDDDVLAAVVHERQLPPDNEANTDGNARFYGFECINRGDSKDPWPHEQVNAMVRTAAAICRAHRWHAASVIGHKEWQPGKIDPAGGPTMARFREWVEECLQASPGRWVGLAELPRPRPAPAPTLASRVELLEAGMREVKRRLAALEA